MAVIPPFDPYVYTQDGLIYFVAELTAVHKIETVLNDSRLWQ